MKWLLSLAFGACSAFAFSAPVPKLPERPLAGKYHVYYIAWTSDSTYMTSGECEVDDSGLWWARYGESYTYGLLVKSGGAVRLIERSHCETRFVGEEDCASPFEEEYDYKWSGKDLLLSTNNSYFLLTRK